MGNESGESREAGIRSCLYECSVYHRRSAPREHAFRHGYFVLSLELDELETLDGALKTFGWNRRRLYQFREADHLQMPGVVGGLREHLAAWLKESGSGLEMPAGARIQLITLPRVMGYVFNPVSFYFVRDRAGRALFSVAEVQNTFGELKPYAVGLDADGSGEGDPLFRAQAPKNFYVSPFSELDVSFDFQLRLPSERLDVAVDDWQGGRRVLESRLTGRRVALTDRALWRMTWKYPLVTARVITLIHWHAMRLWWKRTPWFAKAAKPELQTGVYRPHASLRRADVTVGAGNAPAAASGAISNSSL